MRRTVSALALGVTLVEKLSYLRYISIDFRAIGKMLFSITYSYISFSRAHDLFANKEGSNQIKKRERESKLISGRFVLEKPIELLLSCSALNDAHALVICSR